MIVFTPISIGQFANDGTGDTLRIAFQKINANFSNVSSGNSANFSFPSGTGVNSQILTSYGNGITYWGTPLGAQGNQGNQGNQGSYGGPQGNQGNQGNSITGPQGTQGHQGTQGNQGNTGTQGNQGNQGNQGTTGAGTQGNQGPQGTPSTVQGPQGTQGTQGTIGAGTQGNQGNQGTQGVGLTAPFTLPTIVGANSQVLTSFGNGVTYWGNVSVINYTTANSNPVIDLSKGIKQIITLTSNVSVSTMINPYDGDEYTFIIKQGTTGSFTWLWPNNFTGGGNISASDLNAGANTYNTQKFLYASLSNIFYITTPLVTNGN
jgi:hypothetical protein